MSIDKKIVNRKITLISRDLKNLKEISVIPMAKYLSNDTYEALAERYLERIIGRMIDINYHILSEEHNETPIDYYNSFLMMAEKKYLSSDFAKKIAHSAGLRNRLAHEYDEIDASKVYKAVPVSLRDVPKYLDCILKHIDKNLKQKKLI